MANPTPYERGYSFAGFQSTSPQTPLPGPKVDEELDNLERTTGETIEALADIRRADGKLKNGIVTVDALSAEVMTGIQPAVEWETSTQYSPGAVVFFNTGFYRCLVEHVSGVFATDLAAGKWELFADLGPIVTEAGTARDQAVAAAATASSAASTATTQAGTATAAASAATTQAGNAATSAGTATTQAGVATTKATEAAASAAAALASELAAEAAAATVVNGFQKRVRYSVADGNLSAGQTVFTVPGGYDPNEASVYRSGLYLANGVDVNVSSGTTFTLATPVGASDVVIFEAYGVFNIAAVQASVVSFDDTTAGLGATTAQAAIDKLAGLAKTLGFATRALAVAASIPAVVVGLTLFGWTAVGDAPPATYARVGSEPSHPGKFQSADGAWWERSDADRYPEQSGAVGNGTTDDTTAVSNWLSELQLDTRAEGRLLAGKQFRITSQLPDITRQITIRGAGIASCGFLRDYNGTSRKGLLHFTAASASQGANNSRLSSFYILAAASTTGGALLSGISTADYALSGVVVEDMWLTTLGTNTHSNTLDWDGVAKTTGAIGLRDLCFRNLHIFGANGMSVYLAGIIGLGWYGGGVYPAGGSHASSGGIQITGTSTVKSTVLDISITTSSGLNLTQLNGAKIAIVSIGAISGVSINNDGTCVDCGVQGKPTGTVVSNWTTSGIRRPGAAFATS